MSIPRITDRNCNRGCRAISSEMNEHEAELSIAPWTRRMSVHLRGSRDSCLGLTRMRRANINSKERLE